MLPERLRRTVVALDTSEAPGTVIIDTGNTALYYVLGQGRAIRYGVGVGREGFTWSGVQTISRKAEWPDWHPPAQMIARQPYLPRFMAGGPGNPLGARAMYLGSSEYRIHGTNDPSTIGKFVSSGCIRLTNEDVADLFSRVDVGTKVVVLPKNAPHLEARANDRRSGGCSPGAVAAASRCDDAAVGSSGDEPFDVVAVLRLRALSRRRTWSCDRAGWHWGAAAVLVALALAPAAQAEDFLSALFGAFGRAGRRRPRCRCRLRARATARSLPKAMSSVRGALIPAARRPIACAPATGAISRSAASDNQSRAASCNSFCPASETKVVYGSNIDNAATENGKPYSELPNAFRYRNELVAGCTCNGKDQIGLASVKIEDDPTLRKGDIVAGADGLMVAGRGADRRGASLNFSPASESLRARVPVVASE